MKIFEEKDIKINLSTLVNSRMLLCTNSGGGKSYALRKILEEAGKDVMSIVFDVEGEFKTLRERFDFLLIGHAGDVPISLEAAHLLPQKLMGLHVSTIIDISDLKMHKRILYMKKFLEALMDLPRKYWQPCLVVVDEAHMYCGQQEKQESFEAVRDLMTRGRKRGYCGILATQRISKLHKDAAAEANYYMIGRTSLDIDMTRSADILGFTSKADKFSLRSLKPGEVYFYDPASSQGIVKVKVAKVQTTHPQVGIDLRGKITPPTKRIKAMLSKLSDLPKEADEKARTLEDAKQRIRELTHELRKRPAAEVDKGQLELAEKRGYAKAEKENNQTIQAIIKQHRDLNNRLRKIAELAAITGPIEISKLKPIKTMPTVKTTIFTKSDVRKCIQGLPNLIDNSPPKINNGTKLNRCERSILSLLYNNPQREFTKPLLGVFTGYSHKSGNFKNAQCHLSALGLIKKTSKIVIFNSQAETTAAELLGSDINLYEMFTVENWATNLPKCESTIFQFLMKSPGIEFTREEIGEGTGYRPSSGNFKNAICRLNALGLITRGAGTIKLNNEILDL